jgi:hypothetical protein
MSDFTNYVADKVILTFNNLIINGFAKDTFIEVERDENIFTKYTGALGDVCRSKSLNKGGKVTITLMDAAPINDLLYQFCALDEFDSDSYGTLQIDDLNGKTRCHAEIAWVMKWPKVTRGAELGTIQWEFDCAGLEIIPGGNVI